MQVDKAQIQLLAQVGYAAAMHGFGGKAAPIFDALIEHLPDNAVGAIGYGLMWLSEGRYDEAVRILEEKAFAVDVSADEARAIHLLGLHLAGRRHEAQTLGAQYLASDEWVAAKEMAESIVAS